MSTLSHTSESQMLHVTEDVINKSRRDLVDTGYLEETVLRELHSTWEKKMRQAGLISSTFERYSTPIQTPTPLQNPNSVSPSGNVVGINDQPDPWMELLVSPKRESDGFFIPQQDGANDGRIVADATNVVDENEEILNEDDDEEEDGLDDDMNNIPHLVMCQFDKVKRSKNKWDCSFKSGVMQINSKNVLFAKADGVFNF